MAILILGTSSGSVGPVLLWIGVLVGIIVIATAALLFYRSRVLGDDGDGGVGLFLDELREMRNRGEISQEEFDRARKSMAARAAERAADVTSEIEALRRGPKHTPNVKSDGRERIAPPGFDLTGQPLPRPREGSGEG